MSPESLIEPLECDVSAHEFPPTLTTRRQGYIQAVRALNEAVDLPPLKGQLLKWIGNKQKFATEIISYLPTDFGTYYEPFLGSGAVLAHLAPRQAVAADVFAPLIEIWQQLHDDTDVLIEWYSDRYALIGKMGKAAAYEKVKADYNAAPNGADLLFLSRVCYGGVVRFRKADGYMSTPCGPHRPMPPANFAERARIWAARTKGVEFVHADFEETMRRAKAGDVCYLDPPYADSQTIIYGAQSFSLPRLFSVIEDSKRRGVRIALSIDGTKKSGKKTVDLPFPDGLFEREVFVHTGRSMLRRFQMDGQTLESEHVSDRLLLTY
ncbi:DNA methyltransferase [Ralstonia pickettii]|uniref:Site-specific DNA-methyltransferase (adenine-specific) n=1 Tax=Ralstonia pickettii TaxID=329 RepID=A0A2N4TKY3_RALPI|nr:Dam family site-specific DNA-(adenine-N6)-methyltransferase [Ralstonia pickettii]PLC40370.1 DNA methyltransferase [Ralstonia pickettii]